MQSRLAPGSSITERLLYASPVCKCNKGDPELALGDLGTIQMSLCTVRSGRTGQDSRGRRDHMAPGLNAMYPFLYLLLAAAMTAWASFHASGPLKNTSSSSSYETPLSTSSRKPPGLGAGFGFPQHVPRGIVTARLSI